MHVQALSRIAALAPLRAAVMDFLAPQALPRRALYDVDLVLDELFMNIVRHAHEDGRPHPVDLWIRLGPEAVELHVEDDGRPFDPTRVPAPARPAGIAEAPVGGLGLGLVRQRSRSMSYARRDRRNCLSVTIARR